jgi:hypothetical protein
MNKDGFSQELRKLNVSSENRAVTSTEMSTVVSIVMINGDGLRHVRLTLSPSLYERKIECLTSLSDCTGCFW